MPTALIITTQVVIVVMCFAVLWAGRRWPWLTSLLIGGVFAAGVAVAWTADQAADRDAMMLRLRVGQWLLAVSIPAWVVVHQARTWRADGHAVDWTDRGKLLAAYWFLCFLVAVFAGGVIFLGTTPPGQFR